MSKQAHLADGTVLEFPDETDDAVIDSTVQKHVTGSAATRVNIDGKEIWEIGDAPAPPKPPRVQGTGFGPLDQTVSSVNEALIGIPEGLMNMGSAVTDTILKPFVGDAAVKAAQQQRKGFFGATSRAISPREAGGARTVGQIASTIPFAGAKVAGAAPWINRGIQGLIGGAGVRDSGEGPGWSPGIGAALNIAAPPVLGKAASLIGSSRPAQWLGQNILKGTNAALDAVGAKSALGAVDDLAGAAYDRVGGMFGGKARPRVDPSILARSRAPAAAPNVAQAQPVAEVLGKDAQARLDNFRALGIQNPTTGMVTRDPRAWTFERETAKAAGTGDELLTQFQQVSDGLDRAAQGLVSKRGGAVDPEAVGKQVQDVLASKSKEMQQVTSGLYKRVRETRGDVSAGSLPNFRATLDDGDLVDNAKFDAMRDGLMRRLQRFGMAGESGLLRNDAVATVSQAEELRKFIRTLGDAKDPDVQRMHKLLIDSLDDDVVATHGDDAFKAARASAKARFDEFGKTFAGKLAGDEVAPERIVTRIFQPGVRNSDVRALKQSFHTGTPDQVARGAAAWQGVGQQALTDMFAKARNADETISGFKLGKQFTAISPKLRVMLEPEEYKTVQRIVAAAKDSTVSVPFSAVNSSNTSSAIANLFAEPAGGAPVGKQLVGNILKHAAAFGTLGPKGNIALAVGQGAAAANAANKAAKAALDKVNLAKSPEAAAAAMREMQAKASRDAAFGAAVQRWKDGGFYSFLNKPNAGP